MKVIKFIGILAAASFLFSFNAYAQEDANRNEAGEVVRGPYVTNGAFDNTFIGLGAGVNSVLEKSYGLGKIGLATDVYLGKWFSPTIGVRAGWHGITNTWLWPAGKDTFKADCNIDWHSSPEYRFVYLDADGNETLLRDYGEDPVLHTAYPGTGNLRVYARIKGEEQDPDTYFDYPADFDFARRMRTFEY